VDVDAEAIGLRVNLIGLCGVVKLLQHLARPDAPSFILDTDVCRRVVVGLEEIGRFEMGGEVGRDELLVLTARLDAVNRGRLCSAGRELTTTVPLPQRPAQCPEM
jgi:hypothetical protein